MNAEHVSRGDAVNRRRPHSVGSRLYDMPGQAGPQRQKAVDGGHQGLGEGE